MSIVKVLSSWELAWNTPIKEVELWEYPLREFSVNELLMFPVSGIKNSFVREFDSYETAILDNPTLIKVFVDEHGEEDLSTFQHPENALYIIGRTCLSLQTAYKQSSDRSVKITTKNSTGLFWGHQVAMVVLYDRNLKDIMYGYSNCNR